MTILEIAQGHSDSLEGLTRDEAVQRLTVADAEFLVRFPKCVPYYQSAWREFEAHDSMTAPWGCEWWVVNAAGKLQFHSARYDST